MHKDFVNWGNGVLSNQDPSEMMKPLVYDELTSVVYAEYRIAKKFVHVLFSQSSYAVSSRILNDISLHLSPTFSPKRFLDIGSGCGASMLYALSPPSSTSAILNRFPTLQHLVLVDSSEYMLSQSTSLLNARRSSLSSPLPAITTYPSLLSVLEEVFFLLSFHSRKNPTSISSVWTVFSANFHRTRRESPPSPSLGVLPSSFPHFQSSFALAARSSSPKPVRAGGFIWCGALDRWFCEWRRNRSERRCWRRVRTVRSVRCRTTGRTGAGLRSSASRGRRR